jgi:hypothetical protein
VVKYQLVDFGADKFGVRKITERKFLKPKILYFSRYCNAWSDPDDVAKYCRLSREDAERAFWAATIMHPSKKNNVKIIKEEIFK